MTDYEKTKVFYVDTEYAYLYTALFRGSVAEITISRNHPLVVAIEEQIESNSDLKLLLELFVKTLVFAQKDNYYSEEEIDEFLESWSEILGKSASVSGLIDRNGSNISGCDIPSSQKKMSVLGYFRQLLNLD